MTVEAYFVYVLQNREGRLYIGQTWNIEKRLTEHNVRGKGYTSKFRPWQLVYTERFVFREEALQKERYLKTAVGREWLKKNLKGA